MSAPDVKSPSSGRRPCYAPVMQSGSLTFRQKLTFAAHAWKALTRQHHLEFRPLIAAHVPADGVVVDVGAHAGQFAKLFAGLAFHGQVLALEPGAYARAILARVVRWRRLGNVTVVPFGLSDAPGTAELAVPLKRSGSFGFGLSHLGADDSGREVRRETIDLTTLDALVADRGLKRLDFLKADIEGWEMRMLAGGRDSIRRFRPVIMLELVAAHLARAGDRPDQVWALLESLGYRGYRLDGARPIPVEGFVLDSDYLFIPNT